MRSDDRAVTDASIAEETVRIKRNDRPYRKQRETPHGDPTNVHPHKKLSWQRPTSFTEVTFWAATFAQGHHSWNKPITSAKTSYECDSLGLRFNADLLEHLEIFMLRAVPSFLPVFPIFSNGPRISLSPDLGDELDPQINLVLVVGKSVGVAGTPAAHSSARCSAQLVHLFPATFNSLSLSMAIFNMHSPSHTQ